MKGAAVNELQTQTESENVASSCKNRTRKIEKVKLSHTVVALKAFAEDRGGEKEGRLTERLQLAAFVLS